MRLLLLLLPLPAMLLLSSWVEVPSTLLLNPLPPGSYTCAWSPLRSEEEREGNGKRRRRRLYGDDNKGKHDRQSTPM